MRHNKLVGLGCAVALLHVSSACANRSAEIGPVDCVRFETTEALETGAIASLAGDFGLVVTATSGAREGQTVSGVLTLRANSDALRRLMDPAGNARDGVVVPYYGMSDVDMAEVGALPLGGAASDDPAQPGVLMVQANSPAGDAQSLVMRLGADANERGATPFDGGYTVLRVRYVTPDSLLGDWASGMMTETAAGYFCAIRQQP